MGDRRQVTAKTPRRKGAKKRNDGGQLRTSDLIGPGRSLRLGALAVNYCELAIITSLFIISAFV